MIALNMSQEDSEVPLDLQHAIQAAKSDGEGRYYGSLPVIRVHDCPACDNRLHAQLVIHDGDEILAVQYACACLTLWT